MDINEAGTEGKIFTSLETFLKPKYFKMKLNDILFDTKFQTEGTPRGSVSRHIFFIRSSVAK